MTRAAVSLAILALALAAGTAQARRGAHVYGGNGLPDLDVKGSCADAQKFSSGDDKNTAYKGCMQDEMTAKSTLKERWSSFKPKDRQSCVEQARAPSPSYVEVLTCLEMYGNAMTSGPKVDGRPVPQIGGPVAPGLGAPSPGPAPYTGPRT